VRLSIGDGLVVQPMFWILLILMVASRRVDSITGPNPTPNVFAKNFFVKKMRYFCWPGFDYPAGELDHWTKSIDKQFH
jgi:hypothetical protein